MEDWEKEQEQIDVEAISHVSKHWPLSKFKEFISQFLIEENTEDQWTFEYTCYAVMVYTTCSKLHPMYWAPDFYGDRWNHEKFNKSLKSFKEKFNINN